MPLVPSSPRSARIEGFANAASQWLRRFQAAFNARAWDALPALYAAHVAYDDRQHLSLLAGGLEMLMTSVRQREASGSLLERIRLLGTRGRRIAMHQLLWAGGGTADRFEMEHIAVQEVDEAGQLVATINFDLSDLDVAYAELDARFAAGEGSGAPARIEVARRLSALLRRARLERHGHAVRAGSRRGESSPGRLGNAARPGGLSSRRCRRRSSWRRTRGSASITSAPANTRCSSSTPGTARTRAAPSRTYGSSSSSWMRTAGDGVPTCGRRSSSTRRWRASPSWPGPRPTPSRTPRRGRSARSCAASIPATGPASRPARRRSSSSTTASRLRRLTADTQEWRTHAALPLRRARPPLRDPAAGDARRAPVAARRTASRARSRTAAARSQLDDHLALYEVDGDGRIVAVVLFA